MTRALYALLMFEVVCCLGGVDAGVTTMMVKQLEAAFNLNDISLAAVTLTPVAIGSGLISYPGGLLGDAYKRTAVIAGAVFLWTIATGMVIVVHSPAMLFIARLIAGIGIYGGIPAMASAICDVFPQEKRAYAFGTWNVLLAIGSGVGIASTALHRRAGRTHRHDTRRRLGARAVATVLRNGHRHQSHRRIAVTHPDRTRADGRPRRRRREHA